MVEALQLMDPWRHAVRGIAGSLAAVTLVANAMGNRRVLLSLPPRAAGLRLVGPSRNALAIAVFVGTYRFIERFELHRKRDLRAAVHRASLVAATVAILCVHPRNRTAIVALLSTNALSLWFEDLRDRHPEQLGPGRHSDFAVFLAAAGWIMYSCLFHPESYEPSHMRLIMKYSLTSADAARYLQEGYRRGENPSPCDARHPGMACGEYFWGTFFWATLRMAARVYVPVHLTTSLVAMRHRHVRERPLGEHVRRLLVKLNRSAMYYAVYILVGWTAPCCLRPLGDRSLAWRKFLYLLCGSLPATSLLFETPSRRRTIAVMICWYSFVSLGTVLSRHRRLQWLQQGSGPIRTLLDVVCTSVATAYSLEALLKGNQLLLRLLNGPLPLGPRERRRSLPSKERTRRQSDVTENKPTLQ